MTAFFQRKKKQDKIMLFFLKFDCLFNWHYYVPLSYKLSSKLNHTLVQVSFGIKNCIS